MTPENFCYWLQGWFELNDTIDHREGATPETLAEIRSHLKLVFRKETPEFKIETDGKKVLNDLGVDFQLEQKKIMDEKIYMTCGTSQEPKVYYQQPANSC